MPQPDDDAPASSERRAGKRHSAVLLVGKVTRGDAVSACLVHDISAGGLMARFPTPPEVGEVVTIEVRGLPPTRGTVRWVRGPKAGVQFDAPRAIEDVFHMARADGSLARAPRFGLSMPATVRLESGRFAATAIDISAGGVKLAMPDSTVLEVGQTGQLTLTATGTVMFGRICWVREGACGFRFSSALPLATLAQILAQ